MNKGLVLLLAIFAGVAICPGLEAAKLHLFYTVPPVLLTELTLQPPLVRGVPLRLAASITAMIGTVSDLKISFDCSPDMKLDANPTTVGAMTAGEHKEILINVQWDPKTLSSKSWVRIIIDCLPDYPKLLEKVNDKKRFSDSFKRLGLISKVKAAAVAGKRQITTTDYLPDLDMDQLAPSKTEDSQ
ncbi:MAG: hypothetical protein WA705_20955 [Candidatus Ozemobacteraceae bacterium]